MHDPYLIVPTGKGWWAISNGDKIIQRMIPFNSKRVSPDIFLHVILAPLKLNSNLTLPTIQLNFNV